MNPPMDNLANLATSAGSAAAPASRTVPVPRMQRGADDAASAFPRLVDPINILIVDDEPRNLTVLETILSNSDYRLVRAHTADQALLALVVEEFALLILDIRMPGMTGFELAQMIKGRKKTAQIPIIFFTAYYNEDQHVLTGYDTGAVDYLHKPVNPAILRSKVAVFADLYRKNRECEMANRALLGEVVERHRAEDELRELNDRLDQRVTERTAALEVANEALQQALASAEKANLAKSEFLTAISHDLRTPLNAILGFAQLIESGSPAPTPSQKRSLDQILKGGWFLLNLISEILDLSSIPSGSLRLSLEPVLLSEVINDCSELAAFAAKERDIHLTICPFDNGWLVHADRTRMMQILNNLISNAIKYGRQQGSIEVRCTASGSQRIRISIKDSGIGLTQEQMAQLFQPFNRLGQEAGGEEGSGLGLALSKRLVELMGGTIGVESTVGVGSEFWFELIRDVTPPARAWF